MGTNPYTRPTPGWKKNNQLDRAYWDYYWSAKQIADFCPSCSSNTMVFREMDEYDIPTRSVSDAQRVRWMKERGRSLEYISVKVPDPRIDVERRLAWPGSSEGKNPDPRVETERDEMDAEINWSDLNE